MLKKLLSAMIFALPVSCWALGQGFYVGGGLGADTVDFNNKAYVKQAPNQQKFSVLNETDNAAQGLLGTLFGGYGYIHQSLYLGGEANINVSTATSKTTNSEFDHVTKQQTFARFKILPNWGVSIMPGWLMQQDSTLIYGRLGYAGGIFKIRTSDVSLADTTNTLNGFRYGLGIEKSLSQHWGVRFEYNHIIYQSSTVYKVDSSNLAVTSKKSIILPQTNQFEFGLVYRFC